MPGKEDFREQLAKVFAAATAAQRTYVDVRSGDLHKQVGGYPARNHRMPVCCDVMYAEKDAHDTILCKPEKGKGASLLIRYQLPR